MPSASIYVHLRTALIRSCGSLLRLAVIILSQRTRLVELAAKSRLPAIFGDRRHVDAGGLMSYGPSLPDMFRRAAELVDKILKGASPGDLPIEQPAKFEMVINRKAARALDLELSSLLLERADEVIE